MIPKQNATYLMIPKKLVFVWLSTYILLLLMVGASFQYTNYVFRQLCGVISISDDSYKQAPPPSTTGKILAKEFDRIKNKYHCK